MVQEQVLEGSRTAWGETYKIAYMPSGEFLKFATIAKASAFQFDINQHLIFSTREELGERLSLELMLEAYQRLLKVPYNGNKDPLIVAQKLWPVIMQTSKNPFSTAEGDEDSGKTGKRASLRYYCLWSEADAKLMAVFKTLPRQAQVCLVILHDLCYPDGRAGSDVSATISNEVLEKELNRRHGELKTKQDPWRIFKYYQAKMIGEGLIQLRRA